MVAGVEYKRHLFATKNNLKFFGCCSFAFATTGSGDKIEISLSEYIELGYGAGVRLNISKKARTNIGLDYCWANYGTTGFFLRLNENFLFNVMEKINNSESPKQFTVTTVITADL